MEDFEMTSQQIVLVISAHLAQLRSLWYRGRKSAKELRKRF